MFIRTVTQNIVTSNMYVHMLVYLLTRFDVSFENKPREAYAFLLLWPVMFVC